MARKKRVFKKDGITYRLSEKEANKERKKSVNYGQQISSVDANSKVSGEQAMKDIVRPMSAVALATEGRTPSTDKPVGEQRRTRSVNINRSKRKKKVNKK